MLREPQLQLLGDSAYYNETDYLNKASTWLVTFLNKSSAGITTFLNKVSRWFVTFLNKVSTWVVTFLNKASAGITTFLNKAGTWHVTFLTRPVHDLRLSWTRPVHNMWLCDDKTIEVLKRFPLPNFPHKPRSTCDMVLRHFPKCATRSAHLPPFDNNMKSFWQINWHVFHGLWSEVTVEVSCHRKCKHIVYLTCSNVWEHEGLKIDMDFLDNTIVNQWYFNLHRKGFVE